MTLATNDTPAAEALRIAIDRQALLLRTALPCVVEAVSGDGTTVDVRPAVSMVQRLDGQPTTLDLPVIRGVPIQLLGSTVLGLFVAVPIRPGDDGLLVMADRALDNWQHGEGIRPPPAAETPRHHDLTDAVYLPGLQRISGAIADYPTDAVQLRNRTGTCVLELRAASVRVEVPGGAVVEISGDTVAVTGKLTVSASVASPSIKAAGKELTGHTHGGVTVGAANTGANN